MFSTVKAIAHRVRHFRMLKNKYDLTLCQSHLHTAWETFVCHKIIPIRFEFLRFCIRSMHFDRKGWQKNEKINFRLSVQQPLFIYKHVNQAELNLQ